MKRTSNSSLSVDTSPLAGYFCMSGRINSMASIYPPDMTTTLGTLRGLIPDMQQLSDPADSLAVPAYMFEDNHLQAFLDLSGDKPLLAASMALMALATNEALISKKIRTEDLSTDGPAVAAELRRLADSYRLQQAQTDAAANETFTIVDFAYQPAMFPLR